MVTELCNLFFLYKNYFWYNAQSQEMIFKTRPYTMALSNMIIMWAKQQEQNLELGTVFHFLAY